MKNVLLSSLIIFASLPFIADAQSNYLDNYIGNVVTVTTIGSSTDQLDQPRDLDFKPNSNECWVVNNGTANGGSTVIFYNAGIASQNSEYRKDSHTSHFMVYPSALAFGDDGKWAAVSEIQNTAGASSTFMGPALWLSDTNILARVFQNNWVSGLPLGSHVDMLHQSPFAMGIAHDTAMAYWVMDGWNGNICKYDFVNDHSPGYDDHSAGKIWRYTDVLVTRVPQIPSHMILDKATGWLYFIDGGPKQIKRMNTNTGTITGNLVPPSTGSETLALYKKVEYATVETLDTLSTQPCGIDFYHDRLVVSDYTTGDIYLYSTNPSFTLLQTIQTGHPGMMGVKVGPDGHIWCVNNTESKLYRLNVAANLTDASIVGISSPAIENCLLYRGSFYSTAFNICNGTIAPSIEIANSGTTTITDMEIHYMIDGGIHTIYNWTGSLAPGLTSIISLPVSPVTNGSHQFDALIMKVNGTSDDVDLNNAVAGTFRAFNAPVPQPLTEGFAAANFPPAGWNYIHYNKNNYMSRASAGGFGASAGSMKMDNYSGSMDITGQEDYLISPIIDMSSAGASSVLRFTVAHARYNTSTNDELQVRASTDCGGSWSVIYDKMGSALATAPNNTSAFTPTSAQWRTDSVSLSSYAGTPELLLAFTSVSNYGNNVYIDDIFVGDLYTGVSAPSNLAFATYPNPVQDKLNFRFENSAPATISLTDITGKIIYESTQEISSSKEFSLSLKEHFINPGIYFLSVRQSSLVSTSKIIVQ